MIFEGMFYLYKVMKLWYVHFQNFDHEQIRYMSIYTKKSIIKTVT